MLTTILICITLLSAGAAYYNILLRKKKAELNKCYNDLLEIYNFRTKQKAMLADLANPYYSNMSIYSQKAMTEIDRTIAEVKKVIDSTKPAKKLTSIIEICSAISLISRFNKKSAEANRDSTKDIKNTWETNTEELITIVMDEISESSARHKALGYKVPSARIFRKPTELALQELKALIN